MKVTVCTRVEDGNVSVSYLLTHSLTLSIPLSKLLDSATHLIVRLVVVEQCMDIQSTQQVACQM